MKTILFILFIASFSCYGQQAFALEPIDKTDNIEIAESAPIEDLTLIPVISSDEDDVNLNFHYPNLILNMKGSDEGQYVNVIMKNKKYTLISDVFFYFSSIANPAFYFKGKDIRVFIQHEQNDANHMFIVFVLDEKGGFYQLGNFNVQLLSRCPTPADEDEITFSALKRGNAVSIYSNKAFNVTYKLRQ